jgi:hypothetical protein
MSENILKAKYQANLNINEIKIPCAVLENGTRVLSEKSIANTLGTLGGGGYWRKRKIIGKGTLIPRYVSANYLEPFISDDIRLKLLNPIHYKSKSGSIARGIEATLLPEICDIWLKARESGTLPKEKEKTAKVAEILLKGFAHIGIIGLIDEATGYQEVKDKLDLQKILDKYLLAEQAKWAKRFPDEFYELMFKLKGWQWKGMQVNRPSIVGKYTNDLVYERLAPGLLAELKRLNPPDEQGRRKSKHQQWLTEDIGHPALQRHLSMLVGFERVSANWGMFYRMVQRALPKLNEQIPLALDD